MGILSRAALLLAPRRTVRRAFTQHFERGDWREPESVSGRGSSLRSTEAIRKALPSLFAALGIRSVIDAGCGDFNWFRDLRVDLDDYLGIEVVEALADANQRTYGSDRRRFTSLDIIRDPLPQADLILCRDCLVHLKNAQIAAALRNFMRSGSTYLLATTFTSAHPNADIPLGGWRPVNLESEPFNLGSPHQVLPEGDSVEDPAFGDKSLGLWPLQTMTVAR